MVTAPADSPSAGRWLASAELKLTLPPDDPAPVPGTLAVITLEPGLYRNGYGGCRLEDLVLVTKDGASIHIPSIAQQIYDVSGAGDTVTAWTGAALAGGASVREAAQLANYAAGVEVGKHGVATVSPDEVLAVHEERFDQIGKLRRGGLI